MAGNSFGQCFRITTAGESHGPGNVVIIDGVPPGIPLSVEELQVELDRRRPGQSKVTTQRKEPDTPEFLAGLFEGHTTGTSLAIFIPNKDQRSKDYSEIKNKYRPGHADYSFDAKYGRRDYRGGGRSSARETSVRVAAGVVARKILEVQCGASVLGYVTQVGDIKVDVADPAAVTRDMVEQFSDGSPNIVRCPDHVIANEMIDLIETLRHECDSVGGIAEIVALNVPAGLGEPVFDKIKADLAKSLFSLPAVLGVEYGVGFGCATMKGSEHNDLFRADTSTEKPNSGHAPAVKTSTNRHGGMLGGITTGMPIVLRAAVKPTSSLPRKQPTVNKEGKDTTILTRGRHDPCLLPRFVPMAEAMVAIVLADHWLRWKAQCGEISPASR